MGYLPQVLTHLAQHQHFADYTSVSHFSFTLDLTLVISKTQQIACMGQQGKWIDTKIILWRTEAGCPEHVVCHATRSSMGLPIAHAFLQCFPPGHQVWRVLRHTRSTLSACWGHRRWPLQSRCATHTLHTGRGSDAGFDSTQTRTMWVSEETYGWLEAHGTGGCGRSWGTAEAAWDHLHIDTTCRFASPPPSCSWSLSATRTLANRQHMPTNINLMLIHHLHFGVYAWGHNSSAPYAQPQLAQLSSACSARFRGGVLVGRGFTQALPKFFACSVQVNF